MTYYTLYLNNLSTIVYLLVSLLKLELLKELHLTEGRNTGFGKILRALEKKGSPKPEFETDEDRNYFITRLYIKDSFLNKKNSQNVVQNVVQNIKVDVKTKKRRERLLKILEIISENSEITIEELAIKLNITKRTIDRDIQYLKELKLLERKEDSLLLINNLKVDG